MKQQNQDRALFDAVTGLDAEWIEEAAEPRALHWSRPVLRVAAIAAVLALLLTAAFWPSEESYITGPGMLTVHAHEVDANGNASIESEVLEEGVIFTPNIQYDPAINYREDFPFTFSVDKTQYPGMEITLEVTTNAGIFYKNEPYDPSSQELPFLERALALYYGQHFTVSIDKSLYWQPTGFNYEYMKDCALQGKTDYFSSYKAFNFTQNPSYFDIIIRANDLIIGYCVIKVREINGITGTMAQDFSFEVLEIVSFPQVDGYWQNVTLKYVQEQIERIHAEREVSS